MFNYDVILDGVYYPRGTEIKPNRAETPAVEPDVKAEPVEEVKPVAVAEEEIPFAPAKLTKTELNQMKADEVKALAPFYDIDPELSGNAIKREISKKLGL